MPHRETAPEKIGRYEIRGELGRGMMGVVYDAFDPSLGRHVALKVIHPTLATSAEEEERFERRFLTEARIAARLLHPGIVVVHDVGRDPVTGTLFLAMERVNGRTVTEIVASDHRPSWAEALDIVARVAEALHCAHEQGVVHRDIKPANVMVTAEGGVKVMDFGLAKIVEGNPEASGSGHWVGTPAFMSPEQIRGQRIDTRADIFSLGAVGYTLLTGHRPFVSESVPRLLEKITSEDPEAPSRRVRGLPVAVDAVIARAMAREVDERYPTARAFGEDLDDVAHRRQPRNLRAHRQAWAEAMESSHSSDGQALVDLPLRVGNAESAPPLTDGKADGPWRDPTNDVDRSGPSRALLYLALGMFLVGTLAVTFAIVSPAALGRWVRSIPPLSRPGQAAQAPTAAASPSASPTTSASSGTLSIRCTGLPADSLLRVSVDGRTVAEVLAAGSRPVAPLRLASGRHEVFVELRLEGALHAARLEAAVKSGLETRLDVSLEKGQLALRER